MDRKTVDPQMADSDRANAEWKADPGLQGLAHGADEKGSDIDRSSRAANLPDADFNDLELAGGTGSRGIKGWTGDGKGPAKPEEHVSKRGDAK